MRLGAGAPEPTRPGGEAKTGDECLNPGATVPAPQGVAATLNSTGGRQQEPVKVEGNPLPGQRGWLHADIPPSLDLCYLKTMKEHHIANPLWKAGAATQAMERVSRDRLIPYKEYKRKSIADNNSSGLQEK